MSRKHYRYNDYNSSNLFAFLILVLIVLQWFRAGSYSAAEGGCSDTNLVSNGGLFIITLFLLVACSCNLDQGSNPSSKYCHRKHRHH